MKFTEALKRMANVDMQMPWMLAPGLMSDIKEYDPNILVYWDRQGQRFCIARYGEITGGLHFIAVWQDDDGVYRPLDRRILAAIRSWDMRPATLDAPKDANELAAKMDAQDEKTDTKVAADLKDDLDHLTRANKPQITKALEGVN
jgi:hypothetical protein